MLLALIFPEPVKAMPAASNVRPVISMFFPRSLSVVAANPPNPSRFKTAPAPE
jgi:hypothetical protein